MFFFLRLILEGWNSRLISLLITLLQFVNMRKMDNIYRRICVVQKWTKFIGHFVHQEDEGKGWDKGWDKVG